MLSLYDGVETLIQLGMVFHLPPVLRIYGKSTVGVSEVAVVTETKGQNTFYYGEGLGGCLKTTKCLLRSID